MLIARSALSLLLALVVQWAASQSAAAAPSRALRISAAVPGPTGLVADATLVGVGGQLYVPNGQSGWARQLGGGVAVDVIGAVRGRSGEIYVTGGRTPVFVHDGKTWRTKHLPNRGRATLTAAGIPTLAIGRHLYQLKGATWRRTASANARVLAVWASGPKHAYVLTSKGTIRRLRGTRWNLVRHTLPSDDQLRWLVAGGKNERYAVSLEGAIFRVGVTRATAVALPADMTALEVHAVGAASKGALIAAIATGPAGKRSVLLRLSKGAISVEAPLPNLDAGDRFAAVLSDTKGDLLLATTRGKLRIRTAGQWRDAHVSPGAPRRQSGPFVRVGPARTR